MDEVRKIKDARHGLRQDTHPRDGLSFIHSSLDDAWLPHAEFRVYCNVNRRAGRHGVCNAALSKIAEDCGYCVDITRVALKHLTARNMLRMKYIVGVGNEYRLNPPAQWKANVLTPLRKNQRGSKKSEGTPPRKSNHHPSEKVVGKGIPIEGSPKKVLKPESNKETVVIKDLRTGLTELMEDCREVLGPVEMKCWHKRWLRRAETEPDRLRRVLADTARAAKDGEIKTVPARYAEHRWTEFAP